VTYTVEVFNAAGKDTAHNVTVTDVLDSGLANATVTGTSQGTAVKSGTTIEGPNTIGGQIDWNIGTIAPGTSKTMTYTVLVLAPTSGKTFRNIAQVMTHTETDEDSQPGNRAPSANPVQDDEDTVILRPLIIDVSLDKRVTNLRPNAGNTVTYTVEVFNAAGKDTAHNVTVTDVLDSGLANATVTGTSQGTAVKSGTTMEGPNTIGGVIDWNIGAIAPGTSKTMTYTVLVLAPTSGKAFRNIAQVMTHTETDEDSQPGNRAPSANPVQDDEDTITLDPLSGSNVTWYQDLDNDNFGNSAVTTQSPTKPVGYVAVGGDCNDNNNTVYPGAPELCDGIDNDCDNLVDGLDPSFAPDLVVTNTNDSGDGSLRKAIECARPNDIITFGPAVQNATINLTSAKLLINKNLTIKNTGAGIVYISGVAIPTVFDIVVGNTLSLENLRILSNASATPVIENYGTLNVTDIQLISPVTTYPKVLNKGMMMIWGSYSMKKQ
ncbi:MAG: MopE-related protein, partial [Saprospiraceae bacterium]